MLRSDTLMLDNKLFPLYQERVTWPTFNTEHSSEHLDTDDPDDDEEHVEFLVMTGMERRAIKTQENKVKLRYTIEILQGKKYFINLLTMYVVFKLIFGHIEIFFKNYIVINYLLLKHDLTEDIKLNYSP